jgi:hypothetical protein
MLKEIEKKATHALVHDVPQQQRQSISHAQTHCLEQWEPLPALPTIKRCQKRLLGKAKMRPGCGLERNWS